MSHPNPERARRRLIHASFIVKDVFESAQAFLDLYGIGPWFVFEHCAMNDLKYRGSPAAMDFSLAVAFSGKMMVELIQQHDDAPSAYRDVVATRGYGFHHFAIQSEDYDQELARFRKLGFAVANEGTSPPDHGGGRAAYVDTTDRLPGMTEVMEAVPELIATLSDMETVAANWDGSEPIRVHKLPQS